MSDAPASGEEQQSPFDFEVGDYVVVRIREHKSCGPLRAKFVAQCKNIESDTFTPAKARFDLPGTLNSVTYTDYQAEFEKVDSPSEVSF